MSELPCGFTLVRGWQSSPSTTFAFLVHQLQWEQRSVRMFGKHRLMPRLICAMGDTPYSYSGQTHTPTPWHPWVSEMRTALEAELRTPFNTCLANHYRDGRDSISWHADDERELGPAPTIASVSLGAARTFAIKRRSDGARFDVELRAGDLLVMRGASQLSYLHAVAKCASAGPRINLTFRHVIAE